MVLSSSTPDCVTPLILQGDGGTLVPVPQFLWLWQSCAGPWGVEGSSTQAEQWDRQGGHSAEVAAAPSKLSTSCSLLA